jgi:hypothetical protein
MKRASTIASEPMPSVVDYNKSMLAILTIHKIHQKGLDLELRSLTINDLLVVDLEVVSCFEDLMKSSHLT